MSDYRPYYPDSTNELTLEWVMRQFRRLSDVIGNRPVYTAPTAEVTANRVGTTASSVTDLQTIFDGNVFTGVEAAATPGANFEFSFTGIRSVQGFVMRAAYEGSSTHHYTVSLYNYLTTAWDTYETLDFTEDYTYRYIEILNGKNYMSGGSAIVQFHHPDAGNITHNLLIDYLAIIQQVET